MKAIILAAGRGSRMGNNTIEKPKCLSQLFGKTLLELELQAIKSSGIEKIGIVRGYMANKISVGNTTYFDNEFWKNTNMVKSLCCADEWLKEDNCIVSYSDIVYEKEAIEILKKQSQDIVILYNTNWLELWKKRFENPLDDVETFKIDKYNRINEIGKKTNDLKDIQGQYMGLLKFTPSGWNIIETYLNSLSNDIVDKLDMTTLLSNLIENGVYIYGVAYSGLWLEADNENDLKIYEQYYSN